jgi:murein DD-endopeptidase MepM/ murein hydrolase activator NlpD
LKKKFLLFVLIFTLLLITAGPHQSLAHTSLEQATEQLKEAEAKQKQAAQNLKNAQSKINSIKVKKNQTVKEVKTIENDVNSLETEIITVDEEINALEEEIDTLVEQINDTYKELELLENKSDQAEAELEETKRLLKEAIDRIESRNELLRKRLQHMYTNGTVSYLEVLLGSTSFQDFLDRYDQLKTLVGRDKEVLESNKRDYELVTLKLADVELQLAQLEEMYKQQIEVKETLDAAANRQIAAKDEQMAAKARQLAAKNQLLALKKTKTVQIANLNREEEALADYTEEQERAMIEAAAKVAASKEAIAYYNNGDKLMYPLPKSYRVSSNFGIRIHPITGKRGSMHNGIDFAAPEGTSILAAEAGRVITAGWVGGYGNTVILDHGNGLWTLYAHARSGGIKVKVGDTVKRGQKISEVGTSGNSTGNHLHFEVRLNEKAVEPRDYLIL